MKLLYLFKGRVSRLIINHSLIYKRCLLHPQAKTKILKKKKINIWLYKNRVTEYQSLQLWIKIFLSKLRALLALNLSFRKLKLKKGSFNFIVNQKKHISYYIKDLKSTASLRTARYNKVNARGTKPCILKGLCHVHKATVGISLPFRFRQKKILVSKLHETTSDQLTVAGFCNFSLEKFLRMAVFSLV